MREVWRVSEAILILGALGWIFLGNDYRIPDLNCAGAAVLFGLGLVGVSELVIRRTGLIDPPRNKSDKN